MEKPHKITEKDIQVINKILEKDNKAVIKPRKDGVVIIEMKTVNVTQR